MILGDLKVDNLIREELIKASFELLGIQEDEVKKRNFNVCV